MSLSVDSPSTAALVETITSTLSMLRHFLVALCITGPAVDSTHLTDSPKPLDILHTCGILLKAQTTKLSLLLIHKPFAPSAIKNVVSEVASTCIPAMMSAVEICNPAAFGEVLHVEVTSVVRRVFRDLEAMMEETLAQTVTAAENADGMSAGDCSGRDQLASTGVVWEACNALMELKEMGLVGLVVKKAQQHRALLEDALHELKEWAQDEETEEEWEGFDFGSGSNNGGIMEDMFEVTNKLPRDRTDIKATLEVAFSKLKLVSTLYRALVKRRLETFSNSATVVPQLRLGTLHSLMGFLKQIPELADELAGVLYELNNDEARKLLQQICSLGKDVVKLTTLSWDGREDEYTTWSAKWIEAIDSP